jgi:uncharacterized membrane protein
MATSENSEIKNQMRITKTIYYSLIIGLVLFFIVVIVLVQDKDHSAENEVDTIFTIIVPVFGLIMMFVSRMIYNQMISKFNSDGNLLQKVSYYRTVKIISWAMIEGACFFSLVATILTSNYLYVAVFIFLFGYFILMRPSAESLIRDMNLNSEESDLILKS